MSYFNSTSATAERTPWILPAFLAKLGLSDSTIATPICGRRAVIVPPAASILCANFESRACALAVTMNVAAWAADANASEPMTAAIAVASLCMYDPCW